MDQIFYVGSYTKKGGPFQMTNGEGISVWSLGMDTGKLELLAVHKDIVNPTYLAKSNGNLLLVASDEHLEPGNVLSFEIGEYHVLNELSTQSAIGTATCHINVIDSTWQVFISSYWDSKLSVHDLEDGKIMPAKFVYQFHGSGPNQERQEQSHAHCAVISPDERWVYVCDLGSDRIWLLNLNKLTGKTSDITYVEVPSGYGPRHMVFSKVLSKAYLICELNAHVLTYGYNAKTGNLQLEDDCATLPKEFLGTPSAAAIRLHPCGKSLYVSNRKHNSIAVFSIDDKTGKLNFETRFDTLGDEPRDFNIDPSGKWLVCANQNSDNLVTYELDVNSGLPKHTHAAIATCGTPVSIVF